MIDTDMAETWGNRLEFILSYQPQDDLYLSVEDKAIIAMKRHALYKYMYLLQQLDIYSTEDLFDIYRDEHYQDALDAQPTVNNDEVLEMLKKRFEMLTNLRIPE